ncbi:hypothetical protein QOZ80_2BG0193280 [Eleusine coracana subsp. coracana]|nr:hypothetical protein QOZ80_2BG0193280 [Eleusine coracana subsp. coracana]
MGAYANEEQPVLPRYNGGYSRQQQDDTFCCVCGIVSFIVAALGFAALIWYVNESSLSAHYDIVITGVSGLTNPVSDMKQGGVLLNPVFNISVGIASKSRLYGACIHPRTVIKVSYSDPLLPLAAGNVPSVCVGPRESSELRTVVASGSNVHMPGFLIDNLGKEITSREALFFVEINTYKAEDGWSGSWRNEMIRWVGVGDDAARLGAAAHVA